MNKIIIILLTAVAIFSCEVTGVKDAVIDQSDSVITLSSIDSAFVSLKKEIDPIKIDSLKDEKGLPMVWNGADGLRIEWEIRNSENPIQANDLILANYEARVAMGETYDHNREAGKPLPLKLGIGQLIEGWEKALTEMNIGDKARIMIPSKLAYGQNGYLGKIPRNADIIVEIEIVNRILPITLSEGVKVYKYKEGNQDTIAPVKNQAITFNYFTYKLGKNPGMYDNSYAKGQAFTVKFENDNVVDGLHQGLAILKTGDHAFVEIPSKLAYGKSGLADLVPPNTDIIFDLRIESIK